MLFRSGGKYSQCKYSTSLEIIKKAILAHAQMINGDGEFCTELMTGADGRVIGKVGGEGVYCIGIPEKFMGIAIKIADGNERAVYPVAVRLLKDLGILDDRGIEKLKLWAYPAIKNHRGKIIGYTIPVFSMHKTPAKEFHLGDELKYN